MQAVCSLFRTCVVEQMELVTGEHSNYLVVQIKILTLCRHVLSCLEKTAV